MNQKQRKILEAVFAEPILANIKWQEIENLFVKAAREFLEKAGVGLEEDEV